MFLTIFVSVVVTLWILFCAGLYAYHYVIEVLFDLPITGQSPCTAHAALKQLIERLLQETLILPTLQKAQEHPAVPSDETNRTYEDLLATAIINKVISSCQHNLSSSSAASVSSKLSNSSRNRDDKEYFFGEETLDSKWKTTDLDTSSVSSLEEWIHSDSSLGSKKYVDRVTLTIKQDIEEVSQSDSENEDDDSEYFRKSALLSDDEPNWFLQKRKFQGTHSPVPVPMLVPNPTTDAKVLIGDKEVDETSDLSDIESDYGETEMVPGRQSLLVESKTVIGGKNPLQSAGSESESSADSGVKEVDGRDKSKYDEPILISKTDITVDDDNVEDASILSVYSNVEQEAEYTERYGSLPRTIMKTPTPSSRPSLQKAKFYENSTKQSQDINKANNIEDGECDVPEFAGSYSKREKEKWKHAIEMKNNPYSKENIEKRIKRSNNGVGSLFGPDYYARQAKSPSGGKLKSTEVKISVWTSPRPKEDNKEIHKAIPVTVSQEDSDVQLRQTDSEHTPPEMETQVCSVVVLPETSVSEITSDSDLSYINCYDVENSQVSKKTKEGVELMKITVLNEDTHKELSDENGNLTSEKDKHDTVVTVENAVDVTKEIPKAKERMRFIKLNTATHRILPQPLDSRNLKRHKSETDLQENSFDSPPRVLGRKKDNTLISKIYRDPNVRSFALSNRHHLPIDDPEERPSFTPQLSLGNVSSFANLEQRNGPKKNYYNSDDGIFSNYRRAASSSEEDLLDLEHNSIKKENVAYIPVEAQNSKIKNSTQSVSSEDDLLSEQNLVHSDKIKSTTGLIYSSSEDLLSLDEPEKPSNRKHNILIDNSVKLKSEKSSIESQVCELTENTSVPELSLESSKTEVTLQPLDKDKVYERKIVTPDPEIDVLVKKKIVHNILGQFSKSQQNLVNVPKKINEERRMSGDNEEEVSVSVKDLKKKFENADIKSKVISSLTARSLSKQMRETLKN